MLTPAIAAAIFLFSAGSGPAFTQVMPAPSLVAVEVTMSCGLYTELEASYSNGMVESKEISGDGATQSRLGNLFDLNRAIVSIVNQPCME